LSSSPDDSEKNFWKVDKTIFRRAGIRTPVQRLVSVLKSLSRGSLLLFLFAYPLLMVYIGIAYGAIVFWISLGGSFVIVGVVLSRTGYSRNFDRVDGSMAKGLIALAIAFASIVGFYLGLLQFKLLMVPIFLGVLGVAAALVVLRARL
jgi:hypothetical protein